MRSPLLPGSDVDAPIDVAGVGFGPSNLALAVYARECDPSVRCLFFERRHQVEWHPGMLLRGSRMQISFLKDLVTLRNPGSPYSFLAFTKAAGRLEEFVNLGQSRPTREEYDSYLRWVAADFDDVVRYRSQVRSLELVEDRTGALVFRVSVTDDQGATSVVHARNVVHAGGGRPRVPAGITESSRVIHTSRFLCDVPGNFTERDRAYRFVVAGGGQSAAETTDYLLDRYEQAVVHLVIPSFGLRPTDNSPFVNEQFYSTAVDRFYRLPSAAQERLNAELGNANYGVVREDLIDRLYDEAYLDRLSGRQRLVVHPCSRLVRVDHGADGPQCAIQPRFGPEEEAVDCDGVILATGYERSLDDELLGVLRSKLQRNPAGGFAVSRACRVELDAACAGGLYLQGYAEGSFGIGETLLSHLPFRSRDIRVSPIPNEPSA